ncbi:DUF190 domain-containing protein [Mycobacterium sp. ITM-2016-00317]|uniref:DUF190 domain-containing protein n=1 Tax=Mycobacterium sp. ITM-2016-00317 TaxID=2099694 RepID=UPI00287FE826|nr:DUF190 domain-containing protein [Mycobacterium sp. ITM-2016-00317]WNG89288.1 DUF190 domain-containing protein [Mycobacterium sp. ITM-2016-00317]
MSEQRSTLRVYFAERQRSADRFVADALTDLCAQRGIAASVVLRGIAGFGPAHLIRSDLTLSLSEDPPVTVWATDSPARVRELADAAAPLVTSGMLTIEHGRQRVPDDVATVRLSLHLGRHHRVAGTSGYVAVCEMLRRHGFAAADVFLGVDGAVAGHRRRARFFGGNSDVPLSVTGVGTAAQAAAAVDELRAALPDAVLSVAPTEVCRSGGWTPAALPKHGRFQRVTVHTEEAPARGGPVHRALIRRLRESGHAGGATVLRALWGFRGDEEPHGDRFLQITRHVPVCTVIVGTAADIASCYPIIDEVTAQAGLVTVESLAGMLEVHAGRRFGDLGSAPP